MLAADLKAALKAKTTHSEASNIRLHRAISWLARSEKEKKDLDARFIFQWIAFNAAYAEQFGFEEAERRRHMKFLKAITAVDAQHLIHQQLFKKFSGSIRILIENQYVYDGFWKALRDHDASESWKKHFKNANRRAIKAILDGNTAMVLWIVFDRLYVLRNQLVHGGATWNSKVNRGQVNDGCSILGSLVPLIIALMIEHSELDFGEILYPVVG